MKKLLLLINLVALSLFCSAQGLEDVIVEKYYVSDANDAAAPGGNALPVGSITYRIYVDMAPGWILQSVYADPVKSHDLKFETTTIFYNNTDRGKTTGKAVSSSFLSSNTLMLDSWITLGAASSTKVGVLKADDIDGAITNTSGFLQNTDSRAGIALKTQDGMISGATPSVSMAGLDDALPVFDNVDGSVFLVTDGLWFNAPGVSGIPPDNRVLIAQITTDGVFSYRFNIQIRRESDFKVEDWVYSNPKGPLDILCIPCSSLGVPTGIKETSSINEHVVGNGLQFRVYPNPAKDLLNVEMNTENPGEDNISLGIFDIIGKPWLQMEIGSQGQLNNIDISSIPRGMYIIKLLNGNGLSSAKRFIKN